jgi:BioD-like phosphotransacetylase family protein
MNQPNHSPEYCIENDLVAQKDAIIGLVNEDNLMDALAVLKVVGPMWCEVDYGYKLLELLERVIDRAKEVDYSELEEMDYTTGEVREMQLGARIMIASHS